MLELQLRVRAKEAKRKTVEDESAQMPSKKRCEREERIAKVQLKAFWTCFPLPVNERQAKDVPVEDESEEELLERMWQDISYFQKPGSDYGSEQELIADETERSEQREPTRKCQRKMKQKQQTGDSQSDHRQLPANAKDARQEFVKNLKTCISEKRAADAKKRKLGPTNSGVDQTNNQQGR